MLLYTWSEVISIIASGSQVWYPGREPIKPPTGELSVPVPSLDKGGGVATASGRWKTCVNFKYFTILIGEKAKDNNLFLGLDHMITHEDTLMDLKWKSMYYCSLRRIFTTTLRLLDSRGLPTRGFLAIVWHSPPVWRAKTNTHLLQTVCSCYNLFICHKITWSKLGGDVTCSQ